MIVPHGFLALILISLSALQGCRLLDKLSGREQCFEGLSIPTDGSESDLRRIGDAFCRSKGFDVSVQVSSKNGKIYRICCGYESIAWRTLEEVKTVGAIQELIAYQKVAE
jgi:hypothetical protein